MEKRKNNKGFSLVELIVVVAIMAVLMTVLAPQLLRYVEKSRLQKDNSAIGEIANAIEIAMADEKINAAVTDGTTITIGTDAAGNKTITFDVSQTSGVYNKPLEAELSKIIGASFTTASSTYSESTKAIIITIGKSGGVISITATQGYIEDAGTTNYVANKVL